MCKYETRQYWLMSDLLAVLCILQSLLLFKASSRLNGSILLMVYCSLLFKIFILYTGQYFLQILKSSFKYTLQLETCLLLTVLLYIPLKLKHTILSLIKRPINTHDSEIASCKAKKKHPLSTLCLHV